MYEFLGPARVEQGNLLHMMELDDGEYYVEVKVFKRKPPKTLTAEIGAREAQQAFQVFWQSYPKRNGKHLNKKLAEDKLNKLSEDVLGAVILGARNFAKSQQARDGFAPDAFRWLQREGWKEWQEGEEKERNRVTL